MTVMVLAGSVTVLVTVLVIVWNTVLSTGGLVTVLNTVAVGPETVRVEVVVRVLVTLRPGYKPSLVLVASVCQASRMIRSENFCLLRFLI